MAKVFKDTIFLGLIALFVIFAVLALTGTPLGPVYAAANPSVKTFSDMNTHWSKTYVDALVAKKVIDGFPDGTFKPQGTVTVGEFSKILVTSLGHYPKALPGKKHWAQCYIDKALTEGLVMSTEKEFQSLDKAMTRGQVARMIYRALPDPQAFNEMVYYQYMVKDFSLCSADDRLAILNCFRKGIITGYTDGTFKDKTTVTRAEATAMMIRYLEKTQRIEPKLPYAEGVTVSEGYESNSFAFYISFDLNYPVNNQLVSISDYLNKWINEKLTEEVLLYARSKTDARKALTLKTYYSNNLTIEVLSGPINNKIVIRSFKNE